jgi:import inner membrane translocase subunit TIM50
VVFSSLPQHEGDAIVKKLDPYGCVTFSLYRFATKYKNGVYWKDLDHLNRDLSKVLVFGQDEKGFSSHPDNFVKFAPWLGDAKDQSLEESIDFLEMLAFSRLKDVRPVVRQYSGKTFPIGFDQSQESTFEKQRRLQENSLQSRLSQWFSLGKKPERALATTEAGSVSPYRVRKNERIQMRRNEYQKIKGLMQQQLEAEMKKEQEYYAEHKMALWDLFTKGPPPPPPSVSDSLNK